MDKEELKIIGKDITKAIGFILKILIILIVLFLLVYLAQLFLNRINPFLIVGIVLLVCLLGAFITIMDYWLSVKERAKKN